ncbi:MAG: sulfotransferase domain-containing protein [Candidatus Dependentiae bacterium]|nr:sulfotransferase domain-containing protein [Candidatus Dependentiae bacterium]
MNYSNVYARARKRMLLIGLLLPLLCSCVASYADNSSAWRGPDFIIIGVQKAGTTALWKYLWQHPSIVRSKEKEANFFNYDINFDKGIDWYKDQLNYSAGLDHLLYGESSVEYTSPVYPITPARISALFPHTKIIVVLRNPADRAWSHYKMLFSWGNTQAYGTQESFEYELEHRSGLLRRGLYADLLKVWFSYFPRDQFLIINSDDLLADPDRIVNQVFSFLGVKEYHAPRYSKYHDSAGFKLTVTLNPETRSRLVDYFKPHNQELEKLLGRQFNWD